MPTDVRTDQFGRVLAKGLHDSVVVSLSLEAEHQATVVLRTDQGEVVVTFEGLGSFGITGLRDGAVVATLFAHRLAGASAAPPHAWETLWAGDMGLQDPGARQLAEQAATRFEYLAVVECSYGGAFACLCRAVRVETK